MYDLFSKCKWIFIFTAETLDTLAKGLFCCAKFRELKCFIIPLMIIDSRSLLIEISYATVI